MAFLKALHKTRDFLRFEKPFPYVLFPVNTALYLAAAFPEIPRTKNIYIYRHDIRPMYHTVVSHTHILDVILFV